MLGMIPVLLKMFSYMYMHFMPTYISTVQAKPRLYQTCCSTNTNVRHDNHNNMFTVNSVA